MEMITISVEEYQTLKNENEVLKGLVASLTAKIVELEARLNKNSKNSNKPPSSDGLKKGTPKNNRKPSGNQSGGQPGHKGATKELNPAPDTIIDLIPITKCECGAEIIIQTDDYTVRQVTDIQPVTTVTVEYHAHDGICAGCGKTHKASFPEGANSPVSYGENIRAIMTYLTTYQMIPLKRATELMKDMLGITVSQGTIVSAGQEAYEKLEAVERCIKDEIIQSPVVNFDETGMRAEGKTQWLHSAGTEDATLYSIHEKRGQIAMDEMGILPVYTGTAIHDHWKSYYQYDQCAHGECNEHHLRTLKYLYENLGETWAYEMSSLLLRIKKHIDLCKSFGVDRLEQEDIEEYERIYRLILAAADQSEKAPAESKRLIKKLIKYESETLLFMLDFEVPFTNNLAERDVRMPKVKQKISGSFRSADGKKAFARIRGFISTTKKKGKDVLTGLASAFKGEAIDFLYPNPVQK